MNKAGGYLLANQVAPLWIGEFGNDTRSLANFGLAGGRTGPGVG